MNIFKFINLEIKKKNLPLKPKKKQIMNKGIVMKKIN